MAAESLHVGATLRDMLVWKKLGVCCGLALSVFSARAEAPPPPREFWDYLMEFSDDNGEVFDPADFAAIAKIPANVAPVNNSQTSPNESMQGAAASEPAAAGENKP